MRLKLLSLFTLSTLCVYSYSFTLNILTTDESCIPGSDGIISVTPSGGTAPYTYTWSNAFTTPTITNLTAGIYSLTVTDAAASSQFANITINSAVGPTLAITIIGPSCPGRNNGSIIVNTSSGTPPFTYLWANATTTSTITNLAAGNYDVTVVDANGCSTVRSLTVADPFPQPLAMTVTQNGDTLSSDESGAFYQWLDCGNNNSPIVGDTNQQFIATRSGSYAVEVSRSTCIDTSTCINLTTVGIDKILNKENSYSIYPNPSNGKFSVRNLSVSLNERIRIFDLKGKSVYDELPTSNRLDLDLSFLPKGVYLVEYDAQKTKLILAE